VHSCARRAAYFTRAARLPARRTACSGVSGSFAARARTRCAAPTSPRPSVARQRCAARFRGVKARGHLGDRAPALVSGASSEANRAALTAHHAASFLRRPLPTAPLGPARRSLARITAPARHGAVAKSACHVSASVGRRRTSRTAMPLAWGCSTDTWRGRVQCAQRRARPLRRTALQPLCRRDERTLHS
jgi:hypothetical protein